MKGHQLLLKASKVVVLATEVNKFFLFISRDTVSIFRGVCVPPFSFFFMKEYFEKPHLLVSERCRQPGSRGCDRSRGLLPSLDCSAKGMGALLSPNCHHEMTPRLLFLFALARNNGKKGFAQEETGKRRGREEERRTFCLQSLREGG